MAEEMHAIQTIGARQGAGPDRPCSQSPMQVVALAREYFGLHFQEPVAIAEVPLALGISADCLAFSFDQVRGMTPAQALQLISEALEPRNLNQISRAGFCSIQQAIEVLAAAIKPEPSEAYYSND